MFKQLQTKFLALLAIMLMGGSSAWADTYTWTTASGQLSTSTTSVTINDVKWAFTPTWADNTKTYVNWIGGQQNKYQIGSSKCILTSLVLSTNGISGTITNVKVVWSSCAANNASLAVSVGGSSYSSTASTSSSSTLQTSNFTGQASGELVLAFTATTGVDFQKVVVTYTTDAPSTEPIIVASNPEELAYNATSGEFGYSITNPATGVSLSATSNTDWITNVAVDETNSKVTFSTSTNTGAQRTGTITLSYTGATNKVITITQAAYVAPVIPTGNSYVKVTSTDDITTGQYLIVYEDDENPSAVAFNGALEALDAAKNTIAVTINNNEIAATAATEAAEFTIDVTDGTSTIKSASGYFIGRTSDANGMDTSGENAYTNTISIGENGNADVVSEGGAYLRYNATSGQDRFRYFKSSTYTNQKAIQLYKLVTLPMNDIVITSALWATYVPNQDVTIPEDVKAYIVTNATSNSVTLSSVASAPANTGLVVNGAQGTYTPTAAETTDDVDDNLLVVSSGNVKGDGTIYALGNKGGTVGFKRVANDVTVPAGKPYLTIESNGSKDFFDFSFDEGVATGIESVESVGFDMNAPVYDLQGRQVNRLYKGIFIQNGKKIIVK